MVNVTYIPNRIGIPTHKGNLVHHGLRMEEKTQESSMEPPQLKREDGRKKEMRKKEKKGREPLGASLTQDPST
jgi:hypothetical protein